METEERDLSAQVATLSAEASANASELKERESANKKLQLDISELHGKVSRDDRFFTCDSTSARALARSERTGTQFSRPNWSWRRRNDLKRKWKRITKFSWQRTHISPRRSTGLGASGCAIAFGLLYETFTNTLCGRFGEMVQRAEKGLSVPQKAPALSAIKEVCMKQAEVTFPLFFLNTFVLFPV